MPTATAETTDEAKKVEHTPTKSAAVKLAGINQKIKKQAATGKQGDAGYVQFDTGTVSGPVHSICDSPCKKTEGA